MVDALLEIIPIPTTAATAMKAKLIKTDTEYQAALTHIESLMNALKGSSEEDELELWALLVVAL
jgi:hypothetical protein